MLRYDCFYYCRKWATTTSSGSSHSSGNVSTTVHAILSNNAASTAAPASPAVEVSAQNNEVTDGEWTYDPNEPRYCLCNQVSYGDMVACDNEDVSLKLFVKRSIIVMIVFIFNYFFFSVLPNGFIIHALELLHRLKVNGIVRNVRLLCVVEAVEKIKCLALIII